MNKKGLHDDVQILILILLVLVAMGIVWGVVKQRVDESKPKFKITKEICWEELKHNLTSLEHYKARFCNNQEVEEIKYNTINYTKLGECSNMVNGTDLVMVLTFKKDSDVEKIKLGELEVYTKDCVDSEVYPTKTISKEDLSIKWLKKNCECYSEIIISIENPTFGYKNQRDCFTYKCGDYLVEVLQ